MKFKSFVIAAICAIVQYYDYHLFAFLASRISMDFFGSQDTIKNLSNTFLIISIGYLAKPIGALLLGRIGDIYGRFTTIMVSLSGTAIASLVISLIPGYSSIGIYSAYILLIARMIVTGLVSSGTDGVRLYIFEQIGKEKQCLGNGFITASTQIGSLIASLSAGFFTLGIMPDYGWRFAFALGSLMGVIVIYIRSKTNITYEENIKSEPKYAHYKDIKTYKIAFNNLGLFSLCAILAGCIGSTNHFIILWFGTFNFDILKIISQSKMQLYTSIGITLNIIFAIIGGYCADKFGKKRIVNIFGFLSIISSLLLLYFLSLKIFNKTAFFLICSTVPFINMSALAVFKESIPQVIRYRIFSLSHAVGSIFISGTTGLICTNLYRYSQISWLPMLYLILVLISLVIVINYLINTKNERELN